MSKSQTVLITGASSGIGADMAALFAEKGFDLVLVARRKDLLDKIAKKLSSEYKVQVEVCVKDLSQPQVPEEIYRELKSSGKRIDLLVNNAGFGHHGQFVETDKDAELRMMQLNMVALTHLTKLFVKDMVSRKSGRILNVASTAAFQPGPQMTVYYATKAYVLFFSEALYSELKGSGVTVTCLCPGPTKSGFQEAARMENVQAFNFFVMTSMAVARIGVDACLKGKRLVSAGMINNFFAFMVRLSPRPLVLWVVNQIMSKVRH